MVQQELDRRNAPDADANKLIHDRLEAVYQFIIDWINQSTNIQKIGLLLDIGTWKGDFVVQFLSSLARQVVSFDIDSKHVGIAASRSDMDQLIKEGRVLLLQMDALRMGFCRGKFDIVTFVEVLGAGFDGPREEIGKMLQQAYECLNERGIIFMTFLSQRTADLLRPVTGGTFSEQEGVPLSISFLQDFAEKNDLYCIEFGQMFWRLEDYGRTLQLPNIYKVMQGEEDLLGFDPKALKPMPVFSGDYPTYNIVILGKQLQKT